MRRSSLMAAAAAVSLVAGSAASAQQQTRPGSEGMSAAERQFLKEAGQGNLAEVRLGQPASERAQHVAVEEFCRWMASANGFADRELATITERTHGQTPPASLDAEAQATLQRLSGPQFDQAYLRAMAQDHQKDLRAFQQGAQGGQDHLVRTFAQNMAPAIQEHLKEAQNLQRDLFNAAPSGSGAAANDTVHGAAGAPQSVGTSK